MTQLGMWLGHQVMRAGVWLQMASYRAYQRDEHLGWGGTAWQ